MRSLASEIPKVKAVFSAQVPRRWSPGHAPLLAEGWCHGICLAPPPTASQAVSLPLASTSCGSFCVPLPTLPISSGCFPQGASVLKSLSRSPLCGIHHPVNSSLILQFLKISPIHQWSSVHSSSDRTHSVPFPFWCRAHWVASDRNPTMGTCLSSQTEEVRVAGYLAQVDLALKYFSNGLSHISPIVSRCDY